ncbi:MAG: hypothetical protein QXH30_02915, partial [Candidatus Bilamarchaeaceae archaeon]
MLKPEKMQRVRLVALKPLFRPLISELHRLGVIEIRRFSAEGFETGKTVEAYDRISSNLVRIRSINSMLGLSGQHAREVEMELEKALRLAEDFHIEDELRRKHTELERANAEKEALLEKLRNAERLSSFSIDFSRLSSSTLAFAVGAVPLKNLPAVKEALKKCKMCKFESAVSGREALVVVAHPSEDASAELALSKNGFMPIEVSGFSTPARSAEEFKARISALEKDAEALK